MGYQEKTGEMVARAEAIMQDGMELVDLFVNKNYLIDLPSCPPVELDPGQKTFSCLSLFEISKIVYDQNENINDKLVSVYSALSNFGSTALLLLCSGGEGVRFFLGTRHDRQPDVARKILQKSLRGNFPGIEMREQSAQQVAALLEGQIPEVYSSQAVSAVSIVPSPRDEDKDRFVQGLEKFVDSMAGEAYTAVFVAAPLDKNQLEAKKRGYEDLYSALSQCSQVNLTYSENESEAVAKGISDSFSSAVNEGISDTTGTNYADSVSRSRSHNRGHSFNLFSAGHSSGSGRAKTTTVTRGSSESRTDSRSTSETTGRTTSDTTTSTAGSASTIGLTRQNKTVQALLERIDEQLARIKSCESYGLWDSACYFIAPSSETALVAANTFKAIVAGEKTSVENSFVNLWDNSFQSADQSLLVLDHLRYGMHPRFLYQPSPQSGQYAPQVVTPASMISGLELPVLLGFPHKSVSGVTALPSAEFGRNVFTKEAPGRRVVDLGAVFHMGEVFPGSRVRLDLESLSAHCFITGSTGSGKSNTTYKLLEELVSPQNGVGFLVIEPAKGEYKTAFGGLPGVRVFTTNPKYCEMLGVNPFAFHEEIHVLEHLDRLIEIFSACWPLYAAMPALLKASFEQAYIRHGWDLNHSFRLDKGNGKFPTFQDVVEILPELLSRSEFSAQTKGDYIGSLVTRVESLTNGLVGQIFGGNAVDDATLFDGRVVVDLSRIGSAETKALLMGVLVLKLSEYRQATAGSGNQPLRHVTVLEEAHNLLKRTSTEQGQESANVQGKSVEMISNSIAEMRTYGEGFVIVDQSPSAVDISAIKNTNTKIIMRLPEAGDCQAAGKSIGLNDQQIAELSRLDKGVAAVYQNNWLEAVLTKVDKCGGLYQRQAAPQNSRLERLRLVGDLLAELVAQEEGDDFNMSWFNTIFNRSRAAQSAKDALRQALVDYQRARSGKDKRRAYAAAMSRMLACGDLLRVYEDQLPPPVKTKKEIDRDYVRRCEEWRDLVYAGLDLYAQFPDGKTKDSAFISVLLHKIDTDSRDARYKLALYCIA